MKWGKLVKLKQCNIVQNLNISFDNGAAISGKLKCSCGCDKFSIHHTGKQTRGILATYIVPVKNQLFITAKCSACQKEIVLVDNYDKIDEVNLFELKGITNFEVVCKLNYWPANLKNNDGTYTNNYEDLLIYVIFNEKEKALFEGV